MTGRVLSGACRPSKVRARKGKGWRTDSASGMVRYAEDYVEDRRQGLTSREFADITPGFGTYHPQDVKNLGTLDDPSPIDNARPQDPQDLSAQDLKISDREIKLSIQEGRAPRLGF